MCLQIHLEWRTPPINGQKLEDRTKLVFVKKKLLIAERNSGHLPLKDRNFKSCLDYPYEIFFFK